MPTGHIRRFVSERGFGFIEPEGGPPEVFFHQSVVPAAARASLTEGARVEYEAEAGPKGPRATHVRLLEGSAAAPASGPAPRAQTGRKTFWMAPAGRGGSSGSPRPAPQKRSERRGRRKPRAERGASRQQAVIPLPRSTVQLFEKVPDRDRHPGLVLDRFGAFTEAHDQTEQRAHIAAVARLPGFPDLLSAALLPRRRAQLDAAQARTFTGHTAWRLTLHLARAACLENAGLALHPVYGFAYLPGSGLKGLARAFAETIWLADQPDERAAWRAIEDVFGWAPSPARRRQIGDGGHPAERRRCVDGRAELRASEGAVVFHDAWPASWPVLQVDIVNNHHADYYQSGDVPGDWQSPNPVTFLAVAPGQAFEFALALTPRRTETRLLDLAEGWLRGGLSELGAGAKTAAGYGFFEDVCEPEPALERFDARRMQEPAAPRVRGSAPARKAVKLQAGQRVRARLLEEKTKRGGWKAAVGDQTGPVAASQAPPSDWEPGLEVELEVASDQPQFRWPPRDPDAARPTGRPRRRGDG